MLVVLYAMWQSRLSDLVEEAQENGLDDHGKRGFRVLGISQWSMILMIGVQFIELIERTLPVLL